MTLQKVLAGYRVTLPKDFREMYDIKEGELIEVEIEEDRLSIIPVIVKTERKEKKDA